MNDLIHRAYSRRQELRGELYRLRVNLQFMTRKLTSVPNGDLENYRIAQEDMLQASKELTKAYEEHQLMSETILVLKEKAA